MNVATGVGKTAGASSQTVQLTGGAFEVKLTRSTDVRLLDEAVVVLARSFQDAPNFTAVFKDSLRRAHALPHFFKILVRDAAALSGVTLATTNDRVIGVAVWYPPETFRMTIRRQITTLPNLVRTFLADPGSFKRLTQLGGALNAHHPPEPHWYLAAMAVDDGARGQGIGSHLLNAGLRESDESTYPCYLETFSEGNVRLYFEHGFTVRDTTREVISGGPPFWFMWRAPRARALNSTR